MADPTTPDTPRPVPVTILAGFLGILALFIGVAPGRAEPPVIESIRVESTNLIVTARIPPGHVRITLESRQGLGSGAWLPVAVQHVEGLGGGLPSGHAQNGLVVWGGLAAWARRPWVWTLAVLIIVLLGLSRVYLGVHYPSDVAAGAALGMAVGSIGR